MLNTLMNFGVIEEDEKRYWTTTHPLTVLSQILELLENIVETKKDEDGADLDDENHDFMKQLRIRTYRIKRVVRDLIKKENGTET